MSDEKRQRHRRAVALKYNQQDDRAPRVVAKGDRLLAERIIEIARENNVPLHEAPDLVAGRASTLELLAHEIKANRTLYLIW